MSKEVQIVSWDDYEQAQGNKVRADSTVVFVYNGVPVEIDLSDANRERFEEFIRPYMKAGRRPENPDSARPGRKGYNYRPGAKARKQALRDWADARVREDPSLAERYNYITEGGQYYYPIDLRYDYKAATGIDPN